MSNYYVIYGTTQCAYCEQAKSLLIAKNIDFDYIDIKLLDSDEMGKLHEIAGHVFRTVPQIFISEADGSKSYVGGYTELKTTL